MISIKDFIGTFPPIGPENCAPWDLTRALPTILEKIIEGLDGEYTVANGIAIHKTATVETGVIMKSPVIICASCFVGAHSYLRGGVYLDKSVTIGPSCEIKSSLICSESAIAHFNFIGDSIIGANVNFEAGSLTANYHNDRVEKEIFVFYNGTSIRTGVNKFGSLVGDNCKIGANAVLSPGTILPPNTIIGRLQLVGRV